MSLSDKLVFLYGFLKGLRSKLKPEDKISIDEVCEMLGLEKIYQDACKPKEEAGG